MESERKRDKLFCRKVVILEAAALAPIHYCQLGKLDVRSER
jgi:hypothetical protein